MPKRKAESWPESILNDPDVLSLDDEGRFVLCKICHVYYAVHGGKKPKPIIMNSSFRTRAWEVHKERTNSHRPPKRPSLEPRNVSVHVNVGAAASIFTPASTSATIGTEDGSLEEEHKESENSTPEPTPTPTPSSAPPLSMPMPRGRASMSEGGNMPMHLTHPVMHTHEENTVDGMDGMRPSSTPTPTERMDIDSRSPRESVGHVTQDGARSWNSAPPRRHESHERSVRQHDGVSSTNKTRADMTTEQEIDRFRRWRRMDEDVSRALGSMRMQTTGDHLVADTNHTSPSTTMMETEDFSGNNERVARKLKSLDEEYDARVMRDSLLTGEQRDEMYRRYWGTLRDVYNPANASAANANLSSNKKKVQHSAGARSATKPRGKEADSTTHADSTTPDESGSSDDLSKPTLSADQNLINAMDRLTGILMKHSSGFLTPEAGTIVESLARLTQAVDELRASQDEAFARLIDLQEQKLHVMQALLEQSQRNGALRSAAPPDINMAE